jgi:hypothetical protein
MARSTIDYSKYSDEAAKQAAAIEDIKDYLTSKQYEKLTKDIKACKPPMTYNQFIFACGMAGIEGYPVIAWAKECGIERQLKKINVPASPANPNGSEAYKCEQCGTLYDPGQ